MEKFGDFVTDLTETETILGKPLKKLSRHLSGKVWTLIILKLCEVVTVKCLPFWCLLMAIKWLNEFEEKLLRRQKKLVKSFAQGWWWGSFCEREEVGYLEEDFLCYNSNALSFKLFECSVSILTSNFPVVLEALSSSSFFVRLAVSSQAFSRRPL
jgi:hypothetical protein